jgi:pre-mRNA-processing factor 6
MSKDFLGKPAPIGYVAGIGRGATGFTTRSDIGPARDSVASRDPLEFDEEEGAAENDEGLLSGGVYEKDDEEADRVYESIDRKMDERRRDRREKKQKELMAKMKSSKPQLHEQFKDLKRDLSTLSESEWDSIPEGGNYRSKRTKKTNPRGERFTPVPDSVLSSSLNQEQYTSMDTSPGISSFLLSGTTTPLTDLTMVSAAKEKVLSINLDRV